MIYLLDTILPGQWATMTDAQLAEELNKPATLQPTPLLAVLQAALKVGADPAKLDGLGEKWAGTWKQDATAALERGDLAAIEALLSMATGLGEATQGALKEAIGSRIRNHWQANIDPQSSATAEGVAEILGVRGWTWDGAAWTFVEPEEGGIV